MWKFLILALIIPAAPARAQEEAFAQRPEICVPVATTEMSDCSILRYYRCEGDGQTQFRVELYDQVRLAGVETQDSNHAILQVIVRGGDGFNFATSSITHPSEILESGSGTGFAKGVAALSGAEWPATHMITFSAAREAIELDGMTFETMTSEKVVLVPEVSMVMTSTVLWAYRQESDLLIMLERTTSTSPEKTVRMRELRLAYNGSSEDLPLLSNCSQISFLSGHQVLEIAT